MNRPNFVIILADNLGCGHLECYGSGVHRRPHVDRLAAQGMRLTDFHRASGVRTPSRASLNDRLLPAPRRSLRRPTMSRTLLCLLAAAGLFAARAEVVLVGEGVPPCPVIVPRAAGKSGREAGATLASYLGQMAGVDFAVQAAGDELPARAIVVGPVVPHLAEELGPTDFRLLTGEGRVHVVGGSPGRSRR